MRQRQTRQQAAGPPPLTPAAAGASSPAATTAAGMPADRRASAPGEIDCQFMDFEKVNKFFGWKPEITFDVGLKKTIDWFEKRGVNLKIEDEALVLIAQLSDGSFRDGSKILEELARIAGSRKITKESVEQNYKISSIDKKIEDLVNFLSRKDLKKAIYLINSLEDSKVDARFFTENLISYLHKSLITSLEGKETFLSIKSISSISSLFLISLSTSKFSI